jgi:hypothetical protein
VDDGEVVEEREREREREREKYPVIVYQFISVIPSDV